MIKLSLFMVISKLTRKELLTNNQAKLVTGIFFHPIEMQFTHIKYL